MCKLRGKSFRRSEGSILLRCTVWQEEEEEEEEEDTEAEEVRQWF